MKYYPDELIEEIRIQNDIVDVIGEYVKLERKGKDYLGLCPFHKEKTPSFSVIPTKQFFYCFGCGKGGNVIQFIMNAENLDYIEAVRFLADRARIQLPEGESEAEKELALLKQEIQKINTEAARFFFQRLYRKESEKAFQYLKQRHLSENTIKKFGLGYSPEDWDILYKHLQSKGYKEDAIIKSGLVIPNKSGGYYDRFRNRIMFPIFDLRGNVIGFGGRVIDGSTPKYMNSPETPVYNKGRHLYAMNVAKNSGQKRIIIVEGYMDVISLHQNGIINTVASLGTALTESQGRLLKKYAEETVIAYDADTAGQSATMRGLELLNEIGCSVKVLEIPDGKDPDEFVKKHGAAELNQLIDSAASLVDYKIKVLKKQNALDTTESKISFLNKIADLLVKMDNHVEREMYARKIAKDYEISEESLFSEIYKRIKPKTNFRNTLVQGNTSAKRSDHSGTDDERKKNIHDERLLLALICTDNSVYKGIKDKVALESFTDDSNRAIAAAVFSRLEQGKDAVAGEVLGLLPETVAGDFAKIIQKECVCEDNRKAVLDIIKRMEIFALEKRQKEIFKILKDRNTLLEGDVRKLKQESVQITLELKKKKL